MTQAVRRAFVLVFVISVVATLADPVLAQCATGAREFATIGGMDPQKLRVMTEGWHNAGQELGRFWSAASSNDNNNFAGGCPSNDPTQTFGAWWSDQTGNPNCLGMACRGIRGAMAGTSCLASSCQDDPLVVLVEDYGPSGPPGAGEDAYFFAARIDLDADGAASPRRWDFALVDDPANGVQQQSFVSSSRFPRAVITSAAQDHGAAVVTLDIEDPGEGVWAASGTSSGLPDSSIVKTLDICIELGSDPGRLRESWNCVESLPYPDARLVDHQMLIPIDDFDRTLIAIGLTFDGGAGPDVPSRLVGRPASFTLTFADPGGEPSLRRPDVRRKTVPSPSRRR